MNPTGKRRFTYERAEALRAEHAAGTSINELAAREGFTRPNMTRLLRRETYRTPDDVHVARPKKVRLECWLPQETVRELRRRACAAGVSLDEFVARLAS